jgi:flagellar biogenesis protein FliO
MLFIKINKTNITLFAALILSISLAGLCFAYDDSSYLDDANSKIVQNDSVDYDSTFNIDRFEAGSNSIFAPNEKVSFPAVVFKLSLITFIFISALILIKMYLVKNASEYSFVNSNMDFLNVPVSSASNPSNQASLISQGNILSNLFDNPFQSNPAEGGPFSTIMMPDNQNSVLNTKGLTMKQSLNLTPSQSVYVVEVDGKKLLMGCTQQGGVQLLADLSNQPMNEQNKAVNDDDKISDGIVSLLKKLVDKSEKKEEEEKVSESPFVANVSSTISPSEFTADASQQIIIKDVKDNGNDVYSFTDPTRRRPLKRRSSYRESLTVYSVR